MFSPNMVRYIIDPDNITNETFEKEQISLKKQSLNYNILDYEKVLSDYSFFSRIFKNFGKVFVSQAK